MPAREDGRPYDDTIGDDGLLRYRCRGRDPDHPDNVGLREAMRRRVPLIYFHGIVEGKYEAEYPVFIVGDAPESLTFMNGCPVAVFSGGASKLSSWPSGLGGGT